VESIRFENRYFRNDIGADAVRHEQTAAAVPAKPAEKGIA
jgi:hypothetical protein